MSRHEIQQHSPATLPDPLAPAAVPRLYSQPAPAPAQGSLRRHPTWQQILGGLILAAACVAAAAWYVPRVLSTDGRMLTGSVVTSGVATLNFTSSGEIARITVHQGQRVRKGQVLATQYEPDLAPVLAADAKAVRSEKSRLASMLLEDSKLASEMLPAGQKAPTAADRAAVRAQLKLDEAQQTADQARGSGSQIVAPAAGTIVAANGRPGETVTSEGIRDYATDGPKATVNQTPAFSLLPEGPQPDRRASTSSSALPVIALRTSSSWQVAALVPESSVSKVTAGERVFISVPAAHLTAVPGRISEVLPNPVSTSDGIEYQALVSVAGRVDASPLSGMAANVRLTAPAATHGRR